MSVVAVQFATHFCYMIDGRNRGDRFALTRKFMQEHPAQFEVLMDVLTRAVIATAHPLGAEVWVKSTADEQRALVAMDPHTGRVHAMVDGGAVVEDGVAGRLRRALDRCRNRSRNPSRR